MRLNNLEDAKKYRIGVICADFSEKDLLAKAFSPESLFPLDSVQQLTRMLMTGRVDYVYLYSDTLKAFAPAINAVESNFFLR